MSPIITKERGIHMQTEELFDEVKAIKDFQKDVKSIMKFYEVFIKLKSGDAEILDQLGKALKALPQSEIVGQATEELRIKGTRILETASKQRADGFKRCETAFIRNTREMGKSVREFSQGWRIGPLELQVKREEACASFLYNGETILKWQSISTAEDIATMEKNALSMLDQAKLPEPILVEAFWEAYLAAVSKNHTGSNPSLVQLLELYREFRISLIRNYLEGKAPNKKIDKYIDFPKWAFLYNLDVLRSLGSNIPPERRLILQTGSMNEVSKGKGFVVNGLDAMNEYKVMVYVLAASGVSS